MFFPENGIWQFLFRDIADERVKDWFLMDTPSYGIGLILIYLSSIYVILPRYMAKRKPYELKTFIQCYNLFQVIVCCFMVYGALKYGWIGLDSFRCYEADFSENETAVKLAGIFWYNTMLKGIEFIETIIFALRKKNNQISALHVYHHVSTFCIAWISCKYLPGGMLFITVLFNSAVHILMYSYYYLASLGPNMQKKLTVVKSKLTIIQLAQLIFFFFHTFQALSPNCNVYLLYPIIYIPVTAGNIILFLKFYHSSYISNKKKQ